MFNIATGEDDDHPLGGDIGEQSAAPVNPMPPPAAQAPGPELIPPPVAPAMAPPPAAMPVAPSMPPVAPYQPQALPPIPSGRVVSPAEAQNLGAIDANSRAREQSTGQQGGINAGAATAKDQEAERGQFIADAFAKERNRIMDEGAKRLAARQQQADADYDAFKKFGIKDPQASDNFATRILKAIVVGLGQYSSGINGGQNAAASMLSEANKENIARQKAQQEKLFQVAQKSGKDVEQAKQQRDDAFGQLDLKHAALLESSAAMLRSELARLGVPQAQIGTNKEVQAVEKEALGVREAALKGIRDDEVSLARADIAAAGRKAKSAGAGGGVRADALARFTERANELNPGDKVPPDLVVLGAKAGLKPNQINGEIDRLRNSGGKSAAGADKADEAAYKTYVGPQMKASDELKRRIYALNSAEAGALNPKSSYGEVISALEAGIAADAGAGVRGVSMGQLHSIIPNLVSREGKISNLVSSEWDGTAGEEFRKATLRFIQRAKTERQSEMRERGEQAEKTLAATPHGQRDPNFAKRGRDQLFPGGEPAEAGAKPKKLKASDVEAIRWAKQNPRDPMAKSIFQKNGLDENGN